MQNQTETSLQKKHKQFSIGFMFEKHLILVSTPIPCRARMCEKCGMKLEWSMDYSEFTDDAGQRVFFPRRPHHKVSIYTMYYDPKKGGPEPCLPPY